MAEIERRRERAAAVRRGEEAESERRDDEIEVIVVEREGVSSGQRRERSARREKMWWLLRLWREESGCARVLRMEESVESEVEGLMMSERSVERVWREREPPSAAAARAVVRLASLSRHSRRSIFEF